MANEAASLLIADLVKAVPTFGPVVRKHLTDQEGELLHHVLFGDLARFVLAAAAESDHQTVDRCLEILDQGLDSTDPYVVNLIQVSFVENIGPWDSTMAPFIASWPARLQAEAVSQRDWRPRPVER